MKKEDSKCPSKAADEKKFFCGSLQASFTKEFQIGYVSKPLLNDCFSFSVNI